MACKEKETERNKNPAGKYKRSCFPADMESIKDRCSPESKQDTYDKDENVYDKEILSDDARISIKKNDDRKHAKQNCQYTGTKIPAQRSQVLITVNPYDHKEVRKEKQF